MNKVLPWKELGLLGEKPGSRPGAGKPGTYCGVRTVKKKVCQKNRSQLVGALNGQFWDNMNNINKNDSNGLYS